MYVQSGWVFSEDSQMVSVNPEGEEAQRQLFISQVGSQ